MKREDITRLFPDATAEQVNGLMKINGDDINKAKQGYSDLQTSFTTAEATIKNLQEDAKKFEEQRKLFETTSKELEDLKAAVAVRDMREKVAKETGVPASLLMGGTEDECKAQATSILEFAKPSSYPSVKDGGEPASSGGHDTRQQFAEWFNKQT